MSQNNTMKNSHIVEKNAAAGTTKIVIKKGEQGSINLILYGIYERSSF